ncbi:nucleotide-binding-oligomerization-domain like receptor [Pyrrhoderma noxium]|uniref:Nucleotide-binding-oligomerization-domain like receptor n=1 Tax=Pyrrhoderma noxium TaxID=2282107 RepID=A0A286UDG9_9AGAM|nr:nucleotide-binding-oligomerization-domain like receptor [Pyrrhoderma noxium]
MPYNQPASTSSANFGTYYDIAGNQTLNTFQGPVTVQNNNFPNQYPNEHGTLIRELRDRLSPSNFSGDNRPQCLENTRKHTLQSINEWVNAGGYPNVLLLIGAAGTGKSTIATTIAGTYQEIGQLGCYLFFLRGSSDPGNVLQTIAYSLAVYNQSIASSLAQKLRNSGDIGPSGLKTKFEILLRNPLSTVATKVGAPVLIVLDALDECGTPELRQSLLNLFRDRLSTLPNNFRILITSRPDEDISSLISSPSYKIITLDQHSDESKLNVYTYIKHQFDQMRSSGKLKVPDDYEWDKSVQTLADSADGLFIWASTAVRFVSEERLYRSSCFRNLVSNANSLDLDELYTTILVRTLEWNEGNMKIFKNIFSLIFFAKRPLSDEEINEILDMDMDVTSNVLSYFRSLVRYEPGQPIMIYHTSFYDYLISYEGRPWHVDPKMQRAYITSKCLERMGDLLRYNICGIQSSYVLNKDVPDIDDRVTRYIPPFLKYICCNWAHHLQDVPYSQELRSQLLSFAHNQLLFWFEVLSLTRTFNDHVGPALLFAIGWVEKNDPELSSFLRDAYRQASTYLEPISKSVLQIYTSLLPLTKEESPMSLHYSKYADNAFQVKRIGRKPRNDCIKTIQVEQDLMDSSSKPSRLLLFSPDSTRILSGLGEDVCVWDATSGESIADLLAGNCKTNVLSAAYLPDGRYIIGISTDGIIRKWDVLTGCLVREEVIVKGQIDSEWITSAVFSPDRKSVVFGDSQGSIQVWDVDTGERDGQPLRGYTGYIRCLSFSSKRKYLASGSTYGTIIVWDMDKREVKTDSLRGHTRGVTTIDFSEDGNTIISGSEDENIYVWDVNSGEVLREIKCVSEVNSLTYSPNGHFILASGEKWMSMWNVVDAIAAPKVFQVDGSIWGASFSPDGSRFVSGSRVFSKGDFISRLFPTNVIQIWDATWSVEETEAKFGEQRQITLISSSPGGKFIASGSYDGSICLWNALTGELVKKIQLSFGVISVSFSPINEQLIAFGSWDGTVELWDITNDVTVTIGNHERAITSTAFSPSNEKRVASGSWDATICIWNIECSQLAVGPLRGHRDNVSAIAYSPDGTRLVSGSRDKTVRIWNSETGQLLSTLNRHSSWVNSVAYSFDGSRIVSGSDDKTIIVWDAQSGQIICGPINAADHVKSVCFSPDGKQMFSGSDDNTLRVWDALTGQSLFLPFRGHAYYVNSIYFFPNERRFATGSRDGTIRIWTLDTVPNDTIWRLRNDNWVVSESDKLMMWIPNDFHEYLCPYRNISIFNRPFYLKLHFGSE